MGDAFSVPFILSWFTAKISQRYDYKKHHSSISEKEFDLLKKSVDKWVYSAPFSYILIQL